MVSTAQHKEGEANRIYGEVLSYKDNWTGTSGLEFAADLCDIAAERYLAAATKFDAITLQYKDIQRRYRHKLMWWEYRPKPPAPLK